MASLKVELVRALGADVVVNCRDETVTDNVGRLTDGIGLDLVFDAVGGDSLNLAMAAARPNGQVIPIVASQSYGLSPAHGKGLSLHVVFMPLPMLLNLTHKNGCEPHGEVLCELAQLADAGQLRPLLDAERIALADVAAAHRKLVVDIG